MTFSGCDASPTVDCCLFSICRTQSPEELGRVGERSLGSGWTARLSCGDTDFKFFSFFFFMHTWRRGLGERGDKILRWRHSNCTHYDACRRETAACSQGRSEVRAGRLSSRFRLRAYRTVQTRPVSSRSVLHGIFPDFYFYTHSLQRPHKRRPMASRREQVSDLFFVASTQRRLTDCFPWATEGPNPPKETLTFKKDFLGKQLRDHYPRALNWQCSRVFSKWKQCKWSESNACSEAPRTTIPDQNGGRISCNRWIVQAVPASCLGIQTSYFVLCGSVDSTST